MKLSNLLITPLLLSLASDAAPIPMPASSATHHAIALAPDSIKSNDRCLPIDNAKNFQSICEYSKPLAQAVKTAPGMPVVLGGDHAVEIGNLAGLTQRNNGTSPGVVYFDAHADINSPKTSPSGNVHGMDLHFAIQAGNLDPHRLIYVGMRHPDEGETKLLKKLGIRVITTDEINQHSPEHIAEIIHDTVGHEPHMSFDIDVISQKWVPGTGTPVPHGITPQQAYALVKAIKPGSFSMVEVDPERDHNGQTVEIANQVIKSATHGQRDITLISAPLNLGQPNPGTALGPEAMLKAGLPLLLQEQGHIITLNAVPVAAHQHPTPEHHVQSYFKGHRV